ncbi:MAG: hypothetical protein IJX59_08365, partial [Clostridia bacterium]|nr:hypothetical protein [Clostridia bacterium]
MENFSGGDVKTNCNVERTCQLKNMYVYDHVMKDWISLPTTKLSYGDGNPQTEGQRKFGAHSFGATEEYFWGSTGGKVEDQEAYDAASTKYAYHTITQPDKPTFGEPAVRKMYLGKNIRWELTDTSTPQLKYEVKIVDLEGKTVFEQTSTRPHERSIKLPEGLPEAIKGSVTITDVFGGTVTSEISTDAYLEATGQLPEESPSEQTPTADPSADQPQDENEGKSPVLPIAIGAVVAVIVLAAGITVAVVLIKKSKKS